MKLKSLINCKFGLLTVIQRGLGKKIGKKNPKLRTSWICKCECGNTIEVMTCNLRSKKGTRSCGCLFKKNIKYNFKDLTNNTYGFLKVIRKSDNKTKNSGALWICKCDCGETVELPSNALTSGNNVTCGKPNKHYKNSLDPRFNYHKDIPLSYLTNLHKSACKRKFSYNLTPEYLWQLYESQDGKCALSGLNIGFSKERDFNNDRENNTASLDRKDNLIGYEEGNVRWVHKDVNKIRNNFCDERFLDLCRRCFLNQYKNELRPSFDEYFLMLAFDVSLRSEDLFIKHGAVIVNNETNHILGTGYNATIRKSDKTKIDLANRDERRPYMIHAEENAILNSSINPLNLKEGAKIYVTGEPCINCLQRVINFGIKDIIIADRIGSCKEDSSTKVIRDNILDMFNIEIKRINLDNFWLKKVTL